jgi:cytoskeleton protein RodZ
MDETEAPAPVAPPPAPRSIGERLRAGRERAGLSIAASAEKLHLDIKVIEALEANRFAELGASVYVRGHLRRFADFVGEPGAELVANYTALTARPVPPDLTQVPHPERRTDPRRLVTPLVGLVCAAVLLLAIWWVLSGSHSGAESTSLVTTSQVPMSERPPASSASPAGSSSPPGPGDVAMAPVPAATAPATTTGTPAVTVAANAPPKREDSAPVRETRLKLELNNDSWVEVYDARGERLFYDVASAGSVQSVSGRGPLRVVLGNAAGVTVEVDGEARQIPANAVDGEGARFVVNRSGSISRTR